MQTEGVRETASGASQGPPGFRKSRFYRNLLIDSVENSRFYAIIATDTTLEDKTMKRVLSLLLIAVLCMSLAGCKTQRVKDCEMTIENIGTVTPESEPYIIVAEAVYATLSEEEKADVENYQTLVDARLTYDGLFEVATFDEDNWWEYFDLALLNMWEEDENGEARSLVNDYAFFLLDEYKDKILWDTLELSVDYTWGSIYQSYNIDWNERTYYGVDTVFEAGTQYGSWDQVVRDPEEGILFYFSTKWEPLTRAIHEGFANVYFPEDGRQVMFTCKDGEITRIQGSFTYLK